MTNDTYICGLCRINRHAERLSILRAIDSCCLTSGEKRLVALFNSETKLMAASEPPRPAFSGGPARARTKSIQSLRQRHPFAFTIRVAPMGGRGGGDRDIYERRICTHAHAAAIIVIYGTLDAEMEPSSSSPSHFRPRPRPLEVLL
ncbi:hypothetical protein PO909_014299 [Leuciscus waleckii]